MPRLVPCFDNHNFVDTPPPEPDLEAELDSVMSRCDFCGGLGREGGQKACRVCDGAGFVEFGPTPAFFFRNPA